MKVLPSLIRIDFTTTNVTGDSNSSFNNLTGAVSKPLQGMELAGLIVIGIIGILGTILNSGVLFIVYKGRLVKKDYRMLYYIFITVGDLLFAIHTVLNSLSILYRDFHVFKSFSVCLNLQVTLGVVTYQWSAMCIILLLIDLIWSIRNPFCDDRPKKAFSKISCICAFLAGLALGLLPFAFWNDLPDAVPFCSVANVYGNHWIFAIREATGVLTVLISLMVGASVFLMATMYREQRPWRVRNFESRTISDADSEMMPKTIHHSIRSGSDSKSDVTIWKVSADMAPNCSSVTSMDIWATPNDDAVFVCNDHSLTTCTHGLDNRAFSDVETDTTVPVLIPESRVPKKKSRKMADDHHVMQDTQRKQFAAACRTVAAFMATYLGTCLPYYINLLVNFHCAPDCNQDTSEQRTIRVLVSAFLYLLPVMDPILYTKRFALFKQAARDVLKPCRLGRNSDSTTGLTWRS